jgi:hypothetical protein
MNSARVAIFLLGASLATGAAHAQPAADPNDQAAALFREGREALEKGEHPLACKKFTESLAMSKRASTLLNLAQCEEGQRHLVAALQRWNEGIGLLDANDERVGPSRDRAAALERRIPRVSVKRAPGAPAGTVITMDGTALDEAALGTAIPVDPGDHVLVVTAPGQLEQRSTITLAESERRELTVGPGVVPTAIPIATASATATATTTAPPPSSSMRTMGFVTAAVGLAGLVAAGITGGIVAANDGTIQANCPNKRCNDLGASTLDTSRALLIVNAATLGAGLVGVGAGTVFILIGGPSQKPARTVGIAPAIDPSGAGVRVTGAF